MKLSFSWVGLVVFALPMLINIAYVIFPPTGEVTSSGNVTHGVEIIEAVSRIVYFVLLTFWVNKDPLKPKSVWLLAAVVFFDSVLHCLDPLFYRRSECCTARTVFSFRADSACDFSGGLLFVCRDLDGKYPCGGCHGGVWSGAHHGVCSIVLPMNFIEHKKG